MQHKARDDEKSCEALRMPSTRALPVLTLEHFLACPMPGAGPMPRAEGWEVRDAAGGSPVMVGHICHCASRDSQLTLNGHDPYTLRRRMLK